MCKNVIEGKVICRRCLLGFFEHEFCGVFKLAYPQMLNMMVAIAGH